MGIKTWLGMGVALAAGFGAAVPLAAQTPALTYADQGALWTDAVRTEFYSTDQGARMIPLAWMKALKQANGQDFLADSLGRYGYLPNPDPANVNKLPVGFAATGPQDAQAVGMTCAACHTRQISINGAPLRIDGGPAIVDFQSLLADLDAAVKGVLASDAAFAPFAANVLGASPDPTDVASLKQDVGAWFARYDVLMRHALPPTPWGPARLDAVSMIFNRLTGLDLGPRPNYIIESNIHVADAPVRYPFLWNAVVQDKTQWPGFADNGSDILGLGRNVGEVLGVFGQFAPQKLPFFGAVDYRHSSSINFDGLNRLESLIRLIGPPKWPGPPIDAALAKQGEDIYNRHTADGGCADCHFNHPEDHPGKTRFIDRQTWDTPVMDVHTDNREYKIIASKVKTGSLQGTLIPGLTQKLAPEDLAMNVLKNASLGAILDHAVLGGFNQSILERTSNLVAAHLTSQAKARQSLPAAYRELEGAFPDLVVGSIAAASGHSSAPTAPPGAAYESRVMQGIWAAAPYLHNGSVPTLVELLKAPADRMPAFKIGPAYDLVNVGLAVDQDKFNATLTTTLDCDNPNSGNSRCGHDFGTHLAPDEKKALLEYLKGL